MTASRSRVALAALWTLAASAVVAGWIELATHNDLLDIDTGQAVFITFTTLAAPVLATAVLRRHPAESSGPLVGATVLATMLGASRGTDLGPVAPIAGVTAVVLVLLPAVLVVRHPALRCAPPTIRFVTTCFWTAAVLGAAAAVLMLASGSVPGPVWFTASSGRAPGIAVALLLGQAVVVTAAAVAIVANHRLRVLPLNARRALRPMMLPTIGWCAAITATTIWTVVGSMRAPLRSVFGSDDYTTFLVLPAVLVGAMAAGVGWIDLTVRTSTASKVAAAGTGRGTDVGKYLSRALADPSIRVLYPVDGAGWVDAAGRAAVLDRADPDRAATVIVRGTTVVGLIEQDAAITARPDAVELIATGAGLIMETERLTATATLDLEQARLLAGRLLSASDGPRAQLRAQLLAGPIAGLDAARSALLQGTPVAEVVPLLSAATAQVREISHGVFPLSLTTGGLRAALSGPVVPEQRYPPVIEMTAYLAAVDDPAATIEPVSGADGPALHIRTSRLPSADLGDRIAALGGDVGGAGPGWSITLPFVAVR